MKTVILLVAFIGAVIVGPTGVCAQEHDHSQHAGEAAKPLPPYYCPMHPNVTSDKPGKCPICHMDLIKRKPAAKPSVAAPAGERKIRFYRNPMDPSVTSPVPMKDSMGMDYVPVYEEPAGASGVTISADRQQLIGVKKHTVETRSLSSEIRASARVAFDPELYVAQNEYLSAYKAGQGSSAFLESVKRRLLLLGMTAEEIDALAKEGRSDESLYYPGKSEEVWVYASVYERDAAGVKPGQRVVLEFAAVPGQTFEGMVSGVSPILNSESRTARVRIKTHDPERKLRPETFGVARIMSEAGEQLAVPVGAVLDSGDRQLVYVVINGDVFVPREVKLGARAGDFYPVLEGLKAGDVVVASGNFLIDAETRLKSAQ